MKTRYCVCAAIVQAPLQKPATIAYCGENPDAIPSTAFARTHEGRRLSACCDDNDGCLCDRHRRGKGRVRAHGTKAPRRSLCEERREARDRGERTARSVKGSIRSGHLILPRPRLAHLTGRLSSPNQTPKSAFQGKRGQTSLFAYFRINRSMPDHNRAPKKHWRFPPVGQRELEVSLDAFELAG